MKIYEEAQHGSEAIISLSLKDCQALVDALDHALTPIVVVGKGKLAHQTHRVLNKQSNAYKLAKLLHDSLPYTKG